MDQKTLALMIFIGMYAVMILKPAVKLYAVLAAALLYLLIGVLPVREVFFAVDWNVLLMIAGTMVLVSFFIDSKMPNRLAEILLFRSKNVRRVTIFMSLFAGVISAFIDNVAAVLIAAPVALAVCRKLRIAPAGMLISIAVSSNLQGAATLVGDTTSIMLGAYADMDFLDFFAMNGHPGIFFAVELGALSTIPIMLFLFRKQKAAVRIEGKTQVTDYLPTVLLILMIALLIGVSFVGKKPAVTNGLICTGLALAGAAIHFFRYRSSRHVKRAIKSIDYETLLLLLGLFVVIAGIGRVGIIADLAELIAGAGGRSRFLLYTIVVWGSVIASAFIDNIPYVATMLPVVSGVASASGISPYLLYFGLLCGATLGGNLTPIGASANITAVGLLKKEGYSVTFRDFMRIGLPFTLAAVFAGYLFIWFSWR